MHSKNFAVMAVAVLFVAPVAGAADLSEIYELARANDAQYTAAVHAAAAGREKLTQGRALLLPSVNLTGNARRNHDASSEYQGHRTYGSSNLTFSATQPLVRQANVAIYEQGKLQAQLADQQLKLAEQELLVRVARGYFEVLQAQDALATVGSQKEAFSARLAQAKRSLEVGLSPVTDVNEAQSRFDLTLAQEIAARNDLEVKRRTLEKAINGKLPELAILDSEVEIDVLSVQELQRLASTASQNATQVAIGTTAEQIARHEAAKQSAGHFAAIDLVGSVGKTENANFSVSGHTNTRPASIGVELSLPLYQGGGISSRVREAVANLSRAQSELENARRQAALDASQAFLGVQSNIALNNALRQAVRSGEVNVQSTRRGLEVGVRTLVDVLNAEQQLYATRRDLSAARYQALIAGLQLKAAAGELSELDLKLLTSLLKS